MTKKEFRKKCKAEKRECCKLSFLGAVLTVIGALLVAATMLFATTFSIQIAGYMTTLLIVITGMTLDIIGEIQLSKQYKEYIKNNMDNTI